MNFDYIHFDEDQRLTQNKQLVKLPSLIHLPSFTTIRHSFPYLHLIYFNLPTSNCHHSKNGVSKHFLSLIYFFEIFK